MIENYKKQIRDIWGVKTTEKSVEVESVYPQSYEAYEALNILVGYCVGKGMKIREYKDSDDLLYSMRGPIRELNSIIKNLVDIGMIHELPGRNTVSNGNDSRIGK